MSDTAKPWIEERRAILSRADLSRGNCTVAAMTALGGLLRALNALEQVLEEHSRQGLYEPCDPTTCALDGGHDHIEVDYGEWVHADERVGWACFTCRGEDGEPSDWPCATVQAIEGAINYE